MIDRGLVFLGLLLTLTSSIAGCTSSNAAHAPQTFDYSKFTAETCDSMNTPLGPDSALWVTDDRNGEVLRVSSSGTYTCLQLPGFRTVSGVDRTPVDLFKG